jgi:replicative DNA helicase
MAGEFDLAAYEALVDPDQEATTQSKFNWGEDYQKDILAMLLADRQFLMSTRGLVRPTYFTNKAHKEICRAVFGYWDKFKKQPTKTIILNEMAAKLKDDEAKFFYLGSLNTLYDSFQPGLEHRDYALQNIVNFAKLQAVKEAWAKCLTEIETSGPTDETFDRIKLHWKDAMSVELDQNPGLRYFTQLQERYAQQGEQEVDPKDLFTMGFPKLDNALNKGGAQRGELASVMALPGVGKSLFLTRMAVANIYKGKKVLYISCEMRESDIAQRFDAQFADHNIRTLFENQAIVIPRIWNHVQDYKAGEQDRLVIKWFPSGTADVNTIRGYHEQLKMQGFVPDMIVVDYVGEMKDYTGMKIYESRELLVKDLVGFCGEENMFGATAMQPNRSAREAQQEHVLDDCHLGDAFGQSRPLHQFWSLNQRDDEKQQGVGRCFVIKHRNGVSRFQFFLRWDEDTLRIDEISENAYRAKLSDYKDKVVAEVGIEGVVTGSGPVDGEFFGNKKKKNKTGHMATEIEPE